MDGILLVDKPQRWTSFDVVAKIRNVLRKADQASKVGHTGTLDPLATGLLVIVIGKHTKQAQSFSKLDKVYQVTMKLGQTSTTGDEEGQKSLVSSTEPDQKAIEAVLQSLIGRSQQTPPAFSAVKVAGQRAYKLARAGKKVIIEPRTIEIYKIDQVVYSYPHISFTASVSSGTYIRSLVEDIGKKLGTGAYMSQLRRTQVGPFDIAQAIAIDELEAEAIRKHLINR